MKYLPSFIYINTYTYTYTYTCRSVVNEDMYELDFDIIEYKCNFNNRFYMVKFIDTENLENIKEHMYSFTKNIDKRIEDRNLIFHSSIQRKENGEFIKDVTEELRSFFHYISLNEKCSSEEFIYKLRSSCIWKYIKINIGLDKEHQLLVSLNNSNLTDILIE